MFTIAVVPAGDIPWTDLKPGTNIDKHLSLLMSLGLERHKQIKLRCGESDTATANSLTFAVRTAHSVAMIV